MNSTNINTVGDLKKVLMELERHKCIYNDTPIEINGEEVALAFIQETETISIRARKQSLDSCHETSLYHMKKLLNRMKP